MRSTRVLRLCFVFIGCCTASISGGCRSGSSMRTSFNVGAARVATQTPAAPLPAPGTVTAALPPGEGMDTVRVRCLVCHAPAMLLQQRLTAQQWLAEIDKMQGWGARISDEDKPGMANYLITIAGPDNTRFTPAIVAPISTERSGNAAIKQ